MSSDIYEVKESPWAEKKNDVPPVSRGRRRKSQKSFEDATNVNLTKTHRRRSKNSGFRRFQHQMKKPEFSKTFWLISFGVGGSLLAGLMLWDAFFRYPDHVSDKSVELLFPVKESPVQVVPLKVKSVYASPERTVSKPVEPVMIAPEKVAPVTIAPVEVPSEKVAPAALTPADLVPDEDDMFMIDMFK